MNLTVCGSFGFFNVGDEAIPLALEDMLNQLGQPGKISVLSRFEKPVMPSVIGLGDHDRSRRLPLEKQPLLVSGGGIIEARGNSTLNRCGPIIRKRTPDFVRFLGISADAGVRYSMKDRFTHTLLMRATGKVFARDIYSEATIKHYFPFVEVETIGDLVLWLQPSAISTLELPLPERYIAVALTPSWESQPAWIEWIAGELFRSAAELDSAIVFVPMSSTFDDDRIEHEQVANQLRKLGMGNRVVEIQASLQPREVAAILGSSVLTVAMRLHACVMAYAQRRPFVALAYHPKLGGFAETIRSNNALLPRILPLRQARGSYGYKFGDLNLSEGELFEWVRRGMYDMDFSPLDELKARSLRALNEIIAKWN